MSLYEILRGGENVIAVAEAKNARQALKIYVAHEWGPKARVSFSRLPGEGLRHDKNLAMCGVHAGNLVLEVSIWARPKQDSPMQEIADALNEAAAAAEEEAAGGA